MIRRVVVVLCVPAMLAAALALRPGARAEASTPRRPNLLVIVTDDQRWDTISPELTPNIWNRLVAPGVSFANAFVPNALCCPSRTSILTGRYSHTTGVWTNEAPHGGFTAFDDGETIATDLDAAGYRTAMIGKYLNEYMDDRPRYIPPGWDRWFAVDTGVFYDYVASTDRGIRRFRSSVTDYSTDVLAAQAVSFVRTSVERRRPFFLYFAPTAPHVPATPYPGDEDLFDVTDVPKPPSFGTLIEDGPAYLSAARWDPERALRARIVHERQLASMVDVDRAVGSIVDALPSNTIVVYLSDNGMLWGEHRLIGKGVPYNESIRVPMILTALDGRPLPDANRIVLNVDIRETLESAAGLSPRTEGRDWFDPTWTRTAVVLEHLGFDRGTKSPSFCGVRTLDWMYARYRTGEEELYDERSDPYELVNVADAYPNVAAALRRRAENRCDPPPPRYDWTSPPPSPTPTATASPSA